MALALRAVVFWESSVVVRREEVGVGAAIPFVLTQNSVGKKKKEKKEEACLGLLVDETRRYGAKRTVQRRHWF